MLKIKKIAFTALIGTTLLGGATVYAATQYPSGGTWNYGVGWSGTFGYSDYHHPSRSHTASVKNSSTGVTNSQRAAAGNWAQSTLTKIPPTGLEYYYSF